MDANKREFFQCLELFIPTNGIATEVIFRFSINGIDNKHREKIRYCALFHGIHADSQYMEKIPLIFPMGGKTGRQCFQALETYLNAIPMRNVTKRATVSTIPIEIMQFVSPCPVSAMESLAAADTLP